MRPRKHETTGSGDLFRARFAEGRRNAILRELDRHRTTWGQNLRRTVQEIEEAEIKVIEATPAKKKSAA
jgi:hypothetical protein